MTVFILIHVIFDEVQQLSHLNLNCSELMLSSAFPEIFVWYSRTFVSTHHCLVKLMCVPLDTLLPHCPTDLMVNYLKITLSYAVFSDQNCCP